MIHPERYDRESAALKVEALKKENPPAGHARHVLREGKVT